jgi:hypothetical protein
MSLTLAQVRAAWRAMLAYDAALSAFAKPDLAAAVAAADAWADANASSYNSALPQPFRGQASPQQKAILLAQVTMKRTGVL